MATILVVDDEPDIRRLLTETFALEGHKVQTAANGSDALDMVRQRAFDLALVDIWLPDRNGLDLLAQLRGLAPQMPVVVITCRPAYETAMRAWRGGAYEYVEKPFAPEELQAVVRKALAQSRPPARIQVGELTLDLAAQRVWCGERELALTPREYELLVYLVRRAGEVVTWEELLAEVWRYPPDVGSAETVRSCAKRLRRKIEPESGQPRYLVTVWGRGYRWEMTPVQADWPNFDPELPRI